MRHLLPLLLLALPLHAQEATTANSSAAAANSTSQALRNTVAELEARISATNTRLNLIKSCHRQDQFVGTLSSGQEGCFTASGPISTTTPPPPPPPSSGVWNQTNYTTWNTGGMPNTGKCGAHTCPYPPIVGSTSPAGLSCPTTGATCDQLVESGFYLLHAPYVACRRFTFTCQ